MTDREQTVTRSHGIVRRPRAAHEDAIGVIQSIASEVIEARMPTMGTVTAAAGLNVTVRVDGERTARQVPFTAKAGQEYLAGDRVHISRNRAGQWIVSGSVGGRQDVVNSAQVKTGAIRNTHIVGEVDTRITGAQNTANQGVSIGNQAQSAADNAQSRADQGVSAAAAAQAAASTAQAAANSAQLTANAATTPSEVTSQINAALTTYATKNYVDTQVSSKASEAAVDDLKARVKALEKAVFGT